MSLDLVVLTPANAASFDQALAVYREETLGTPDNSGELEAYAKEVYDASATMIGRSAAIR